MQSFVVLFLLAVVSSVAAHGFVQQMNVGGRTYTGPDPYRGPKQNPSPIRKIARIDPITSTSSSDLTCGISSQFAAEVATAQAGSQVTFTWKSGNGKSWGHSYGPILTYLAKCDGDCKTFDAKNAQFFKIAQTGRKPGSMEWYQVDIKRGKSYTMTIPKDVPSGNYIMRHEIIALHFAEKQGGAQFYPSCSQLTITGTSGQMPDSKLAAHFPGTYKATDPGIWVPNLWNKNVAYVFPGPALAFGSANNAKVLVGTNTTESATSTAVTSTSKSGCTHNVRRSRIMGHMAS